MINIATDGACKGNPGPGGWGVAIFDDTLFEEALQGGSIETTNNRMELRAFIEACLWLDRAREDLQDEHITIHIDSTYVLKGATEWLRGWRQKDYKGVKNSDLWRQIADLRHIWNDEVVTLKWVKGHSGDVFNEKADELANSGYREAIEASDGW
ncbi:Rnase H [Vibrio phage D148]